MYNVHIHVRTVFLQDLDDALHVKHLENGTIYYYFVDAFKLFFVVHN